MLPKKHRIVSNRDILAAYKTRYKEYTKYYTIFFSESKCREFKLLVVVSKKVFKKSNKRHRIKRKVSSYFELLHREKRLPTYCSCIIQIKSHEVLTWKPDRIQTEFSGPLTRLYQKIVYYRTQKHIQDTMPK